MASQCKYIPNVTIPSITTREILAELKAAGGNSQEFYYLYVSKSRFRDADNKPLGKWVRGQISTTFREEYLLRLLKGEGWRQVRDHDRKITYKALYFKKIERDPSDDDDGYISRVNEIRDKIDEKAKELRNAKNIKFKMDSLLSRAFIYDKGSRQDPGCNPTGQDVQCDTDQQQLDQQQPDSEEEDSEEDSSEDEVMEDDSRNDNQGETTTN